MTTKDIAHELRARGYEVREEKLHKNGEELDAITIIKAGHRTHAAIHTEQLLATGLTVEQAADRVEEMYKNDTGAEEIEKIFEEVVSPEYIKEHLYIALQKNGAGQPDEVFRKSEILEGVEDHLRVTIHTPGGYNCIMRVTKEIMKNIGLTEQEVWELAHRNTCNDGVAYEMNELVADMMRECGTHNEDMDTHIDGIQNMYVLSNQGGYFGAATVYNKELLKKIAEAAGTNKVIIIPSSVHEVIVMPYRDDLDEENLNETINTVNNQLQPEEVLSDRAYIVEV